jgi:hypothetical protein
MSSNAPRNCSPASISAPRPELGPRLESAGHRETLLLVMEVQEMEAEAREQHKIARLRRTAQLPPSKTFEALDAQPFFCFSLGARVIWLLQPLNGRDNRQANSTR